MLRRIPVAERAQQFQKAYHEAGEKMEALIGAPEFVEQVREDGAQAFRWLLQRNV